MSTGLTGTVALITGATSGIGEATAFALAGRGAHVLVGGRDAARGEAVVTSLRASGAKADFIDVDLGSSDSARELARRATELGDGHVRREEVRTRAGADANRGERDSGPTVWPPARLRPAGGKDSR